MKLKTALHFMLGTLLCIGILSPASALTVKIDNKSGHANVWVMIMGNTPASPPSLNVLTPTLLTALPLSDDRLPYFTIDRLLAGRIYFSFDQAMPAEEILDPTNSDMSNIRYDWVELTEDGTSNATANLTAVEQFGIPMSLRTYKTGEQVLQAGFCKPASTLTGYLTDLSNDAIMKNGNDFIRALSPIKSPTYPSFQSYIERMKGQHITIKGLYYGIPAVNYDYEGSMDGSGTITLASRGSDRAVLQIPGESLSEAIYSANGVFYIKDAEHPEFTAWDTGKNDVNAAVYRDVITGFNMGYFGIENDSSKWSRVAPYQNGNGNQYAMYVHQCSDSYGYSYTDNSNKVLLEIGPTQADTLKITLLDDHTMDGCSRAALGIATGSFDQSAVAGSAASSSARNDVVRTTFTERIYYAFGETGHTWENLPGRLSQIASGDLNGDVSHEVFGLTSEGHIFYTEDLANWQWIPGVLSQIAACDLNGDQKEDLIGIGRGGMIFYTTDLTNWQFMPGILKQLACADLDGDGQGDVAGVTASGEIYLTLDRENWRLVPGKLAQIAAGHLNEDSHADLVGVTFEGQIYFTVDLAHWIHVPGTLSQVAIGEFGSNLQGDLVGLTPTGEAYYTVDRVNWLHLPLPTE